MPTPQYMRGVGEGSQKASRCVHLVGALHDGRLLGYSSLVLGEDPGHPEIASVPLLNGFDQFSRMNSTFDSRSGRIICIHEGESVSWPKGTRILQREQVASGHCLVGVGYWDRVSIAEVDRVKKIRAISA